MKISFIVLFLTSLFIFAASEPSSSIFDQENIITPFHLLSITNDIQSIKIINQNDLVLFIGSSLDQIKSLNSLPGYINTRDEIKFITQLFDFLYKEADKGSNKIIVLFSFEDDKFAVKAGESASKSSIELNAKQYYEKVAYDIKATSYSAALYKFVGMIAIEAANEEKNKAHDSTYLIVSIVCLSCLVGVFLVSLCFSKTEEKSEPLLAKESQTEYALFKTRMNKLKESYFSNKENFLSSCCLYCFDDFSRNISLNQLNCGHSFHTKCYQTTLSKNRACITCDNQWSNISSADLLHSISIYHLKLYPTLNSTHEIVWNNYDFTIKVKKAKLTVDNENRQSLKSLENIGSHESSNLTDEQAKDEKSNQSGIHIKDYKGQI